MVIDTINQSIEFYHQKLCRQDTVFASDKGKFQALVYPTLEEVGKDENKKQENFYQVFLTEVKNSLPFYIDLRSDDRFKCCHDLLRSKNEKEKDFYENFVKGFQQPFFKLSQERWNKVKECIAAILA